MICGVWYRVSVHAHVHAHVQVRCTVLHGYIAPCMVCKMYRYASAKLFLKFFFACGAQC